MEKHLKIALRAARAANKILRAGFATNFKTKAKPGEIVANSFTKYDLLAQKAILKILNSAFPSHSYLAEEGVNLVKQSDYQWIVDPLDGTTNFSRGLPYFSSSIALAHKGKVVLGVVALPLQNEFSGPGYRVINFVADLPVRIDKFLCRTSDDPLFVENGAVVFVLTEFQIVDARTADQNESGENSHERYKERQAARVKARLMHGLKDEG